MRVGDVIDAMKNDAIYRMTAVASNKVEYRYFLQPASLLHSQTIIIRVCVTSCRLVWQVTAWHGAESMEDVEITELTPFDVYDESYLVGNVIMSGRYNN